MARKRYRKYFGKGPLDYIRLPKLDLDPETKRGIFIVLVLAFGAISFLSLFGMAGSLGVYLARGLLLVFGWGKWFFPPLLLIWGYLLYRDEAVKGAIYIGAFLFVISLQALFHMFIPSNRWQVAVGGGEGGGYLGLFLATNFVRLIGFWGALISVVTLLLVSLMMMFNKPLTGLFGPESWFAKIISPVNFLWNKLFRGRRQEEEEEVAEDEDEEEAVEEDEEPEEEEVEEEPEEEADESEGEGVPVRAAAGFSSRAIKEQPRLPEMDGGNGVWHPTNVAIELPLDLLSGKIGKPTAGDVKENSEVIKRTLENFGIPVEMGEVTVGPTVTQYTLRPADGVKLTRITALNNDLSLSLAAHPIRIEAPIPGKSLVGIEVPNQATATVGLREVLENENFKKRESSLLTALGKDVSGKIWCYDLVKMPHLLVAGQTNSGKSVCLNSIIIGLLYQNSPDDLRLILVDPKRVGMAMFDGLPHLLTPIITEADKTINALRWCINEMERRFDLLSKYHRVDIKDYNQWVLKAKPKQLVKLPYLVLVVDELADLKTVAAKDIEAGIIRLAQKGRASGIHLILATQRPSVDVITGLIKANLPARIAFAVSSGIDSKTILDSSGAEKLLGKGDMLFQNAEMSKPRRLQGAFVSTAEIKRIVGYLKERISGVEMIDKVLAPQKVKGMAPVIYDGGGADGDELLEEAKEIVINTGRASTSLLQRRLAVGYGRAAKILDLLEEQGVIGPPNGSKPREVMVSQEEYEAMISDGVSGVSLHNREETEAPESYLGDEGEEGEGSDDADEEEDEEDKDKVEEGPARHAIASDAGGEGEESDTDNAAGGEEEDDGKEKAEEPETVKPAKTKPAKSALDDVYSETDLEIEAAENKRTKKPLPGDDDFDKLFSR